MVMQMGGAVQLNYSTSTWASDLGFTDIGSLASVVMGGVARLVIAPRFSNVQTSINLGPAPAASPQGDAVYAAQTSADFGWQITDTSLRLFNLSAMNTPMTLSTLQANGIPNAPQTVLLPAGGVISDASAVQVLEFSSGDWIAIATRLGEGVVLHQLSNTGALAGQVTLQDTEKTFVKTVDDTATLQRGADQLLITMSALENGVSSYLISADGTVRWIDSYGAQNGLPINGPAMLKTVQIAGVDFALLASSNSSSLTVLRVNPMGVFFETDHIFDTRDTRFANIAAFDPFVAQGRVFIAAAGVDIGMTLLELLPDGTLHIVETFVLEGGTGLTAVTAITAQVMEDTAAIFMVDSGADRVLRYDLDLGNLGGRIQPAGGVATGTAADERLIGSAQNDAINGGGGNDFLHDGAGSDVLTGGAGADVFIFSRDGSPDVISDFQDGVDRIDISNWGRIYTASVLQITPTANGAVISYGSETLTVQSHNGAQLNASLLTDADFIF